MGEQEFLSTVLENAAQPIWVVDHTGTIRFANPATLRALGYERAEELAGRDSHHTIHGSAGAAAEWLVLRPLASGQPVVDEQDWFVQRDGTRFRVSYSCAPIDLPQGRGVVVVFTSLGDRGQLVMPPREPEALHRVAAMVAEAAPPDELFAAVTEEIGHLLRADAVTVARYEPGDRVATVASWAAGDTTVETRSQEAGEPLVSWILDARDPVRTNEANPVPTCAVSSPIVADGRVWGHVAVRTTGTPFPLGTERRLSQFADLVSTAIQNADAQAQLQRLANEQAALRRVATLVARESPPAEVFAAVTEEVGRLLAVEVTTMHRYDDDAATTYLDGRPPNSNTSSPSLPGRKRIARSWNCGSI